jgi:hypothetical protein
MAEEIKPQEDQTVVEVQKVKGTTSWGLKGLSRPTPEWANWMFRATLYFTAMTSLGLHSLTHLNDVVLGTVDKWIVFINAAVHGASRLFGVKIDLESKV